MAVNVVYGRNLYPGLGGESVADLATGPWSVVAAVPSRQQAQQAQQAVTVGGVSPLTGLLVFGALVAVVMYLAQHVGEPDDFRNLRASAYNVLLISLVALAGLPVLKAVIQIAPLPAALKTYAAAA